MKRLTCTVLVALLSGCATVTKPVPDDYKGPVVSLADTGMQEDSSKGQFFVAEEMDGNRIQNALAETRAASYGKGSALFSRYTVRSLPVRPMRLKLVGTHQTGAPIHELASKMAGTFFSVEGYVDFKPVEDGNYQVTGELKKEKSCVWIVDTATKNPVTEKVCKG
jgi:hypothetical protein